MSKRRAVLGKASFLVACSLLLITRPAVVSAQANDITVGVNLVNALYNLTASLHESILEGDATWGAGYSRGHTRPKGFR